MKAKQHGYYSVGENKGTPRIWLQGGALTASNFCKGANYEVIYNIDNKTIILRLTNNKNVKTRVVSGRKTAQGRYTPIIDLASMELLSVTGDNKKIRADFMNGEIHISIHHLETKQNLREKRLYENTKKGIIKKGVLCSGIGVSAAAGHDGFLNMGIKSRVEFIVDRERKYLDVSSKNNHAITPKTKIFESSLEELEPELLDYVDVLSFSLPCTGQSPAGKAKNAIKHAEDHATDATAILGLMRIIDACQPSILVSENVVSAKDSATYSLIKGMLNVCGYHIHETILDSSYTHSIENRKRYWFVAVSKGLPQIDLSVLPEFKKDVEKLADILDDIPDNSTMWKSTKEKIRKAEYNKANGKNFGFNLIDGNVKNIGVCGKGYSKDRASEPHIKGKNNTMRLLTVNEICRAQNTPLHLVSNISNTLAYEGLGQAIDYRQAQGIFRKIAIDIIYNLENKNIINTKPIKNILSFPKSNNNHHSNQICLF